MHDDGALQCCFAGAGAVVSIDRAGTGDGTGITDSIVSLISREGSASGTSRRERVSYSNLPTACAGPTPPSHTSCGIAPEELEVTGYSPLLGSAGCLAASQCWCCCCW